MSAPICFARAIASDPLLTAVTSASSAAKVILIASRMVLLSSMARILVGITRSRAGSQRRTMGAVSGSTKQGGDAPQRSPDVPTIVAPVDLAERWAPSLQERSAGGRAL